MIEEWNPHSLRFDEDLLALSRVLHAAIHAGASVSFILPFSLDDARAFWIDKVLPGVRSGTRHVLIARTEGETVATVQLNLDTPPNQRHRADVAKLLVHPAARRRGLARALMVAAEQVARREGRTLLTLDTVTGGVAELLYRSLGYVLVGPIPRYSLDSTGRKFESTSVMYKDLASD